MFNKIKDFFMYRDKKIKEDRSIFITLLITSGASLYAAFILSVEAWQLAGNPNIVLDCNINAVINCATVASSSYAVLFGFPNSFIGLATMPWFVMLAVTLLFGAKLPRKFMFIMQILSVGALIFALSLFYISTVLIQVICPWCMLVLISTIVMFFALTKYNIRESNLYIPSTFDKKTKMFIEKGYDKFVIALIIVAIAAIIILKYGNSLFA
ncbi:MAG: vitamin K epoxide reductase family protein [Candidatus Saccharibacteria bacterium]